MIPPGLTWLSGSTEGRAWLSSLPQLVNECAEHWRLQLGEPFPSAYVSLPIRAKLPDDTDVVLKMQFPDRESEHEAAALATGMVKRASACSPMMPNGMHFSLNAASQERRYPSWSKMPR